jgi:hypothetical protein
MKKGFTTWVWFVTSTLMATGGGGGGCTTSHTESAWGGGVEEEQVDGQPGGSSRATGAPEQCKPRAVGGADNKTRSETGAL